MTEPCFLDTPSGRRIAYKQRKGKGPGVVFLSGFKSDMEGTKAQHLDIWARRRKWGYLRFDYSGHGASSEKFEDGAISDWAEDAAAAIEALTEGPQVLVGSSMGGWVALLLARRMPERVAALIGIAAAPDFTEDSMWASFSNAARAALAEDGQLLMPSEYDEPYVITRRLIEDGRANLVLREPLDLPFPVRLLQGTADVDVKPEVALRLLEHAESPDMTLNLVKGADHRFSDPSSLAHLDAALADVLGRK